MNEFEKQRNRLLPETGVAHFVWKYYAGASRLAKPIWRKKLHSKSMPDCHGPGKITTRKFKRFHYSATDDFLVHHHDFLNDWRDRSQDNRDFKIQRRGRRRERQKNNRFYKQNNSFARASHFFCTFLSRFCTTKTWKCLISCFMEDVNKQRRNFISLSELGYGPLKFSFRRVRLHLTK